jgi:hypothetical protein
VDGPITLSIPTFTQSPACDKDVVVLIYVNGEDAPGWVKKGDADMEIYPDASVAGL